MIVRIVKMEFHPDKAQDFLQLFEQVRGKILRFPGVISLALLRDLHDPCVFFTISHWDNEESIERYRHSDLFQQTWSVTKTYFRQPAQAWSTYEEK